MRIETTNKKGFIKVLDNNIKEIKTKNIKSCIVEHYIKCELVLEDIPNYEPNELAINCIGIIVILDKPNGKIWKMFRKRYNKTWKEYYDKVKSYFPIELWEYMLANNYIKLQIRKQV